MKATTIGKVDLQLSLEDHEAFGGARVLVPTELALHHGHANAVVVHVEGNKVLVALLDRAGSLIEIHHSQWSERGGFFVGLLLVVVLGPVVDHEGLDSAE